jgi:FHA domain-containing protein/uncharacterized protein DUF1707
VSTDAHTPVPLRPTSEDRERVVRVLRDRSVEGRLSTDTFAERVGLAYQAKSGAELVELTSDVRPARLPRRLLLGAVEWLPRIPTLALPRGELARLSIGRGPSCDCLLPEESVSRRHAELRREGERWFIRDLGSRNGTRVNGMRVLEEVEVRPGDRITLGEATYRLSARA